MTALGALLGIVGAFLALGPAALALGRSSKATPIVYGASLLIAISGLAVAGTFFLARAQPQTLELPIGLPWLGSHFRLDALSAFFVVLIDLGAAAASLYAIGYGRHEQEPQRVHAVYPLFLAGMNLVPLADDAYMFLLGWEFMSLASWALVMAHHRNPQNLHAGSVYILMASFGTFALLFVFGLLATASGNYDFATMRATPPGVAISSLALLLALVGAGSKAGLAPLHVWLPLAHPAAPSHVSALMSGVMTKVAVYAFIRISFDLIGLPDWRWSVLLLVVGSVTALIGVLHALMEVDLKRALAYSTVENIGLVFLGLGLAMAFKADGMPGPAALAMTASLLHAFNHMLFKCLLFFGVGAVLGATGEKDMSKLGGLLNRMPAAGLFMLIGAVSISALPPLNGFVSEWLLLQAVLLGPLFPQWTLKLLAPTVGAAIALTAALAAACFLRVFGITFLGRPRSPQAMAAQETDRYSLAAMAILAALCLFAGVLPGLKPAVQLAVGGTMPLQSKIAWLSIAPIAESRSSYNGLLVFLFIILSGTMAALAIHRFASDQVRRAPAWDCGFPEPSPSTQYTAESFAQPIRRVFGGFAFRVHESVDMPEPGQMRAARLSLRIADPVWDWFYVPIGGIVFAIAGRLNALQFLTIRQYLSIVFGALVLLLLALAGAG